MAAAMAWLAGERQLAVRLLAAGTGTWALSKLVKQMVRRPRPASLLPGTHRRGPDAAGLGYLSGHAGVAVALGAAALPHLGPVGRSLALLAIPAVGLTRVYVGAHLPLDIVGGAALGLAVDAAITLAGAPEQAHVSNCAGPRSRPDRPCASARASGPG
ncbi:MAG: phosphatase PAP2 family protein [Actinobacteria bacterium]|nr:phosphatase PAP2 family protein [Actinomycetota bacterium]